jgi:UDP-N-acetylmuramoylalanine--D-glutamate ligase
MLDEKEKLNEKEKLHENQKNKRKKEVGVIGLGVSGKNLVSALIELGYTPVAFEKKSKEEFLNDPKNQEFFERFAEKEKKIEIVFNYQEDYIKKRARDLDFFVLSSGIKHDLFAKLGVNFKSELDFVFENLPSNSKIILITGTKGKGSTTEITSQILRSCKIPHFVGGNIGKVEGKTSTLADAIFSKVGLFVFEISSFQLRSSRKVLPYCLSITCITKDHSDFHPSFFDYFHSKIKFAERSKFLVYSENFKELPTKYEVAKVENYDCIFTKIYTLEWMQKNYGSENQAITIKDENGKEIVNFDLKEILDFAEKDKGEKIDEAFKSNLLCALGNVLTLIKPQKLLENIKQSKIPYLKRKFCFEYLGKINIKGKTVHFINDSKSTNPTSLKNAIQSVKEGKIILIAGGRKKGLSFSDVGDLIKDKVKMTFLIGEAKYEIAEEIKDKVKNFLICENLDQAVQKAVEFIENEKVESEKEYVILFSPGCASFPDFNSAEHRGEAFDRIFHKVKQKYET